jgi:predicted permease
VIPRAARWHTWSGTAQDVRLALRALLSTPIITSVALLSLALGMGANTAVFSVVNSLLLRPLPVRDPERLAIVSSGGSAALQQYSYATFNAIRRYAPFDGALAWAGLGKMSLTHDGASEVVYDAFVSGDYFTTLGVAPLIGRTLTVADDQPGGGVNGPVAVISYALWQRSFGGTPDVVGRTVTIERTPVTIVGVAPQGFFGVEVGRTFDVALPIRAFGLIRTTSQFDEDVVALHVMVRLRPGQSLESARSALAVVQPAIRVAAAPKHDEDASSFLRAPFAITQAGLGLSGLRVRFERPLVILLGVVSFVLIIASVNVANLLLARGVARRTEFAVRLALGASQWHLARQLLVESAMLGGVGMLLGVIFAKWAGAAAVGALSTFINPISLQLPLDWRVFAFAAAVLVGTVVLFGAMPVLWTTRVQPVDTLKEQARSSAPAGLRAAVNGLIVAQVALSLTLVIVAGLLLRTFIALQEAPLGFDRSRVLSVTLSAPTVPARARNGVYHQLVKAAANAPGVAQAGGALSAPLVSELSDRVLVAVPGASRRSYAERESRSVYMTPGWLAAYGTPILAGRDIDDHDSTSTTPVAIVNEALARRLFADRSPLGQRIELSVRFGGFEEYPLGATTIVGVVGDAVYSSIQDRMPPTVYLALAQDDDPINPVNFYLAARPQQGSPLALINPLTTALRAVNPDLNLTFRPLQEQVDASLAQERLVAAIGGFFAVLALTLAGIGLYGVISYAVAQRRTEIGIRMAIGAAPSDVRALVLSQAAIILTLGVALGGAMSVWAARLVAALLFNVQSRDPIMFGEAVAVVFAVGIAASIVPAWRASRLEPSSILRQG